MKLVSTRRDLSVWVMAAFWLLVNLIGMIGWGKYATIVTNPFCLIVITAFVLTSINNKKLNDWLNKKIN